MIILDAFEFLNQIIMHSHPPPLPNLQFCAYFMFFFLPLDLQRSKYIDSKQLHPRIKSLKGYPAMLKIDFVN